MTQQTRERGGENLSQWQRPNLEGLLQSTLELLGLHIPCLWQCGKVCGNEVANSVNHVRTVNDYIAVQDRLADLQQ